MDAAVGELRDRTPSAENIGRDITPVQISVGTSSLLR
jgi:hypothetical protein